MSLHPSILLKMTVKTLELRTKLCLTPPFFTYGERMVLANKSRANLPLCPRLGAASVFWWFSHSHFPPISSCLMLSYPFMTYDLWLIPRVSPFWLEPEVSVIRHLEELTPNLEDQSIVAKTICGYFFEKLSF